MYYWNGSCIVFDKFIIMFGSFRYVICFVKELIIRNCYLIDDIFI